MFNLFFGWTKLAAAVGFKPQKKTAKRYQGRTMRLEEIRTPTAILPVEDTDTPDEPGFDDMDSDPEFPADDGGSEEDFSGDDNSIDDVNPVADGGEETEIPEELEDLPFIFDVDSEGENDAGDRSEGIDPAAKSENPAGDETDFNAGEETVSENAEPTEGENIPTEATDETADPDEEPEDAASQSDRTATAEASDTEEPETADTPEEETVAEDAESVENSDDAESESDENLPAATTENDSDNSEENSSELSKAAVAEESEESGDEETEGAATAETEATEETEDPEPEDSEWVADAELSDPQPKFDIGTFTVGETGEVEVDYLYDGGGYGKGEVALVSLAGMEGLDPKSVEFIREAATRAASNSELGHTVISDRTDAARFTGDLNERDWNFGQYQGVKTFSMRPGDEFFIMLVPNGKVQDVLDNPSAEGAIRPLFSFATANPDDAYHVGQIADVTGEGNTFAIEDLRADTGTDKDYNDIVLQFRGAKGTAPLMDDLVAEGKDWRTTDMGQALVKYAKAYITPDEPNFDDDLADLVTDLESLLEDAETSDEGIDGAADIAVGEEAISSDEPSNSEVEETVDESLDRESETEAAEEATASDDTSNSEVEEIVNEISETDTEAVEEAIASDELASSNVEETVETGSGTETEAVEEAIVSDEPESSESVTEDEAVNVATEKTEEVTEETVALATENSRSETSESLEETADTVETSSLTEETVLEESEASSAVGNAEETTADPEVLVPIQDSITNSETSLPKESVEAQTVENLEASPVTETLPETEAVTAIGDEAIATEELATETDATEANETSTDVAENVESSSDRIQPAADTQPVNSVNTQFISRLETLTQTLKERGADGVVSGGNAVNSSLIERLETLTENLKTQSHSTPVSANAIALVSRLEDTLARSAPPAIGPVETGQFEFAVADQPFVGNIDTGLAANNPDIDYSRIILGRDRIDNDDNPLLAPGEGSEHGTHTSGIIGATHNNGIGIDGINDKAPLWIGRAVGSGKWSESLVEFVDAARESGQPNAVVNLSLDLTQINPDGSVTTRYEFTPQERAAIEYARQHNVMIVVAAGNDGSVMSVLGQSSQEFDNIITVGAAERVNDEVALSKAYNRADYSSYGNGLDIMAPVGDYELSTVGDGVGTMAGTSVATAKVTGAASLVWAANPQLSYRQVIEILKDTATDLAETGFDTTTGAGLLNMVAAVQLAKATKPEDYDVLATLIPETWSGEGKVTPGERAVNYPIQPENFSGWVMPTIGVALRNSTRHEDRSGLAEPYHKTLSFDAWTYGERVTDYQLGTPDELWYRVSGTNYWVPSAYIYGFPGSRPSVLAPAQPQPQPQPQPQTPGRAYTIKTGDTLNAIALRELGDANRWREIKKADGSTFTDTEARYLQIGQVVYLPSAGGQPQSPNQPSPNNGQHIIDAVNKVNPDQWYYRPRDITGDAIQETFCNWFAADVLDQLGVPIPRNGPSAGAYTKPHPIYGTNTPYKPYGTDQLLGFMNGGGNGMWEGVSAADAVSSANKGQVVLACSVGHVAVVIPGGSGSNVRIAQAGATNGKDMSVSTGFHSITPTYFRYKGTVKGSVSPNTNTSYSPPATPGQTRQYIIKSGDTLSGIALSELGNANRWRDIKKADGSTFTEAEARQLRVGQSVYLPVSYQTGTGTPVTSSPTSSPGTTSNITWVNFSGTVGPSIGVNLRNSPRFSDRSSFNEPYNKRLEFDAWTYGETGTDMWTGQPDNRWFKIKGKNLWVPSCWIYGNPPSDNNGNSGGSGTLAELDKKSRLTVDEIRQYRQLVAQLPQSQRPTWYRKLQYKVPYFNQRDNGYTKIADLMCNLTSLASCLTYLGVKNPTPSKQFEDALETILRNNPTKYPSKNGTNARYWWDNLSKLATSEFGVKSSGTKSFPGFSSTDTNFFKNFVKNNWQPALDQGKAIMAGVSNTSTGHIVKILDIDWNRGGIVVDDPYGKANTGASKGYSQLNTKSRGSVSTQSGQDEGGVGNDNFWSWSYCAKVFGATWYLMLG